MADMAVRLGATSALELESFEHKSFIPFSELKKSFTRDKVYELLRQYDLHFHFINETVDRVLDGGLRTFALLGAVQDIGSITRFIKEDQFSGVSLDARLPLQGTDISWYFSNPEKGKLFLRRQWSFLAPVFSENRSCRELDDRVILPFLHKRLVDKGGFGKLYRINVDASHYMPNTSIKVDALAMLENREHQSKSTQPVDLICKQLEQPDDEGTLAKEFDHEVSILSALRCLQQWEVNIGGLWSFETTEDGRGLINDV